MGVAGAPEPKEPEKPKPPMKIRARTIDTWVSRVPAPPAAAKPGAPPAPAKPPEPGQPAQANAVKYQLDTAHCEDDVIVHQDPTEPDKPRGVDILGRTLHIDGSPDGNVMTVVGWPNRPGEVHQEEMSLIGPHITLDQVRNAAAVKGRGALKMPTNSDLSGGELAQPEVVVVHWRDEMDFKGALRSAKFLGKVSARQGESWVVCHTMHVVFDRPVYFNQAQKKTPPPKSNDPKAAGDDKPKIDKVFCHPVAGDSTDDKRDLFVTYKQIEYDKTGKPIKDQTLTAQELEMFAQMQDTPGGEKYQRVVASGPGVLRIWQPGDKDPGAEPAGNKPMQPMPMQPGAPQAGAGEDQEMKLTIVTFNDRMVAIDKAKVFQTATFQRSVQVINVPADSPNLDVQPNRLPPRAVFLTCAKELVVSSHKKGTAPPVQRMDAYGNAYLRTDEYDGVGETITNDDKLVILTGSDALPARIMNRFNTGNDQIGKKIKYDRKTKSWSVLESFGGTITGGSGGGPKK
jgi:hypothetical protein